MAPIVPCPLGKYPADPQSTTKHVHHPCDCLDAHQWDDQDDDGVTLCTECGASRCGTVTQAAAARPLRCTRAAGGHTRHMFASR